MLRNPHTDTALTQALEELRSAAARDFEHARPPPVNHSLAFLDFEREAVFEGERISIGRVDEIADPGD